LRVLSIPASGTIHSVTKYLIHSFPYPRTYDFSGYVTFRRKGGVMDKLYSVLSTVIVDFDNSNWSEIIRNIDGNEGDRISQYIDERSSHFGFENTKYMFWILKEEKILQHEPRTIQNYNSHVYISYNDLCNGEKIVFIESDKRNNEKLFMDKFKEGINGIETTGFDASEKRQIIRARIGQSFFKQALKSRGIKCALCLVDIEEFLIASHIKPWRDCSTKERLDINNGLLFCPNHDWLFDKGFISFDENGKVMINSRNHKMIISNMIAKEDISIQLNKQQLKYMSWHRERYFRRN